MKKKLKSLMTPFEKFFAWEAASGLVLLACAVLALLLANSPLADAYACFTCRSASAAARCASR